MGRTTKLSIRPITPTIGAEVEGVDLTAALDASEVADIRQALLDHLGASLPASAAPAS